MVCLFDGTNDFNDECPTLLFTFALEQYMAIADAQGEWRSAFRDMANALQEAGLWVRFIAIELSDALIADIASPDTEPSDATVARALRDGEQLLLAGGPQSAVDRFYTALHGRLRLLARSVGHEASPDASITDLYKHIRNSQVSSLTPGGPRARDLERVLAALATILDALKPLRNKSTLVHPNDDLLEEPEAQLAINAIKAVLIYLTQKNRR